jgi:hypothetical protein
MIILSGRPGMPLDAKVTHRSRRALRIACAVLMAVGVTACAEEPPPERYVGEIEAEAAKERLSLKDIWDNGTTVHYADPAPTKAVYTPPARARRGTVKPAAPRIVTPVTPPAAPPVTKSKPSPPDLALSSPPPVQPPAPPAARPLPPKALTERDLQQDTVRCGVGIDCLAVLQAMIGDPRQSWMMRAPTPVEFANGTRLFAYRALRKTLDCGKLRFAAAELQWAIDTFGRDVDGMDGAHRTRVSALAIDVRGELEAEIKQRC